MFRLLPSVSLSFSRLCGRPSVTFWLPNHLCLDAVPCFTGHTSNSGLCCWPFPWTQWSPSAGGSQLSFQTPGSFWWWDHFVLVVATPSRKFPGPILCYFAGTSESFPYYMEAKHNPGALTQTLSLTLLSGHCQLLGLSPEEGCWGHWRGSPFSFL